VKIAFVYAGGRESRWQDALAGRLPSDFFYGAVELARAGHEVSCIDAPEANGSWLAAGYNALFDRNAPARTRGEHVVAVARALSRLHDVDAIVAASTSHANALARWKRNGRLRARLVGIHCGHVNFEIAVARQRATARAMASQDIVLFADSERADTVRQFSADPRRVHTAAFGVDVNFWTPAPATREFVLSVGNDGRRDYATMVSAVADLAAPVKIVTARPLPQPLPPHVEHLRGSWHAPAVTDEGLRDLYRCALVTVVPLEDAIQPSGQSVALQALACGSPVVLTRTRGWWGGDDFADCLELVEPRSPEALRTAIQHVLNDGKARERMSLAAREAALAHGRIDTFAARLADILATPSIS